ncbi:MAG: hypothetical protein GY801_16905 [bacterium]|nr:hypothetical protein [bacterium]
MLLTGRIEKIDRSPYQAFLTLSDTNIKSIRSLTLQGSDDELVMPLDANGNMEIDVYVWLADNIQQVECAETHYLIQEHDQNGTSGCGEVVRVIETDELECIVNGLAGTIRIESERAYDISVDDTIKFSGELHAEI